MNRTLCAQSWMWLPSWATRPIALLLLQGPPTTAEGLSQPVCLPPSLPTSFPLPHAGHLTIAPGQLSYFP